MFLKNWENQGKIYVFQLLLAPYISKLFMHHCYITFFASFSNNYGNVREKIILLHLLKTKNYIIFV